MADKKYTFQVDIDENTVRSKARSMRAAFERELGNIRIDTKGLTDTTGLKQLEAAVKQQAKVFQQTAVQAAQSQRAADQQATASAKASAAERINASRAEAQERINASRAATQAAIEAERRLTAQTRAEIQQRQAANKTTSPAAGGGGGSGAPQANPLAGTLNMLKATAATYLTVQGVKAIAQMAANMAQADTSIRRANAAFVLLSGSVAESEARMLALQRASNGTIDRMTGISLANTIAALKLADTAKGFYDLGRASREITLVSPVIKDMGDAMTQLALFAANPTSFARADQLGLSASEVRDRMKELRAENSSLDAEQAKLIASTELLDQQYGKLLDTTEAQASGVEKLSVAWSDFYNQQSGLGKFVDNRIGDLAGVLNQLATVSGFGQSNAFLDAARTNLEAINKQVVIAGKSGPLSFLGVGDSVEGQAKIFEVTVKVLEQANQAVLDGVPGAVEYRARVQEIVTQQSQWGKATTEQANQLSSLTGEIQRASVSWKGYQENAAAAAAAAARVAGAGEFAGMVSDINQAIVAFSAGTGEGMSNIGAWVEELKSLRAELLSTGQLTEDQKYRLDELVAASKGAGVETGFMAQLQEQFGSSLLGNNEAIQTLVEAYVDLNAGLASGRVVQAEYDAGMKVIQQSLSETAQTVQNEFTTALANSMFSLTQLDQLAAAGVPGLQELRNQLVSIRDDISGQGFATPDQLGGLGNIEAQIQAAANAQQYYAGLVDSMGATFLQTNQRAAELVAGINQIQAAHDTGAISAQQYAVSLQQMVAELANITVATEVGSTDSIGLLAGAIQTLDAVAAGGVPGLDTLLDQALNLESQISATGIVTEQQAASIEYLASVSDIAASSTGIYAQIQNALGTEFLANNEMAAGLVGQIIQLIAAHDNGTISSGVFAGALGILTSQLVSTGEQAGLTAQQINAAFGALQNFNAQQAASFSSLQGYSRGQNLGALLVSREQQLESNRRRMEQERLAKEQERLQAQAARKAESAFNKAAKETERAFEKAAQELEGELKNVPGLFSRSKVTQDQLDAAKSGIPQNFADDFLRRLEAEINENKDIWPDVSLEKAREALDKVGIKASEDSKIAFQQIAEAWESGVLFSNKENLDLINAEAVKAAVELQRKAKEGQQNIMDHFKNVIGIAVDAATGKGGEGGGGGGTVVVSPDGTKVATGDIPDEIKLDAPDGFGSELLSGVVAISTATVEPSAFLAIDAALAARAFSIRVDTTGGQRLQGPSTADGKVPTSATDIEGVLRLTSIALEPSVLGIIDTILTERIFTLTIDTLTLAPEAQAGFQEIVDGVKAATKFELTPTVKPTAETEQGIKALLRLSAVSVDPAVFSTLDTILTERIFTLGLDGITVAPDVLGAFFTMLQTAIGEQRYSITPVVTPTAETETGLKGLLRLTAVHVDPAVLTTIDTILTERIFTLGVDGVTIDQAALDKFQTDLNASVSLTPTIKPTAETETGIKSLLRLTAVSIDPAVLTTVDTILTERIFTLGVDGVTIDQPALDKFQTDLNAAVTLTPTIMPTKETETGIVGLLRITAVAMDPVAMTTLDTILSERRFGVTIYDVKTDADALATFQSALNTAITLTPTVKPTTETETGVQGLLRLSRLHLDPELLTTIDTILTERIFTLTIDALAINPEALPAFETQLAQAVNVSRPDGNQEGSSATQAGLNYAMQAEQGFMSYAFPGVGLSFVVNLGSQIQAQQESVKLIGNTAASWIMSGMQSFDFSLALIAMVGAMRASLQQDAVVAALTGIGVDAVHIIRDGLAEEAGEISWAGILADAITANMQEEFAASITE